MATQFSIRVILRELLTIGLMFAGLRAVTILILPPSSEENSVNYAIALVFLFVVFRGSPWLASRVIDAEIKSGQKKEKKVSVPKT